MVTKERYKCDANSPDVAKHAMAPGANILIEGIGKTEIQDSDEIAWQTSSALRDCAPDSLVRASVSFVEKYCRFQQRCARPP